MISDLVENMIGKGGHAEVYQGRLPDGMVVAVKRLMNNEKEAGDRAAGDFLSELGIIAHINHPNAARLIGFGIDRGLYFVLQFAPHGSLSSLLFGALLHLSLTSKFNSSFIFNELTVEYSLELILYWFDSPQTLLKIYSLLPSKS